MDHNTLPKLAALPTLMRWGIAVLVLVLLGGYVVSGMHLRSHYDSRDGKPGLTINDIKGHYHGVRTPSPLIDALNRGHPEDLPEADREALLDWLASGENLSLAYDDLDLGDEAPAEIIATACIDCHSRGASGPNAYPQLPLEYWDDIQPIAYETDIKPTTPEIIAMSQHTHAPSMAVILLVLAMLGAMTRAPQRLLAVVVLLGALGLAGDMASWWLARGNDAWVLLIVGGGAVYGISTTIVSLAIVIDCVIPARRSG